MLKNKWWGVKSQFLINFMMFVISFALIFWASLQYFTCIVLRPGFGTECKDVNKKAQVEITGPGQELFLLRLFVRCLTLSWKVEISVGFQLDPKTSTDKKWKIAWVKYHIRF